MDKIERVRAVIEKAKKDCAELEEKGQLTERGRGQLDIVAILERELEI